MSLIKQLWIAIALIMIICLGGSFVVSMLSARSYMAQELAIKNMDNATSLALSLSQLPKDDVTVELQVSAQFDTGHYRRIVLRSPNGETLAERSHEDTGSTAPDWFVRLIPIQVPPGVAQIQDGWRQFGTLTLETHNRYAYDALWRATKQLLLWFIGAGLLAGIVGTFSLKYITRPLGRMVDQAEAIGQRRFVTTKAPRTAEFRRVVQAMNGLSVRVQNMLAEETRRLESLRRQSQHDELTGLLNRRQFMKHLEATLARNDAQASGLLLLIRFSQLAEVNRLIGRGAADDRLVSFAHRLDMHTARHPGWECGRINAAEFALLAPAILSAADLAEEIGDLLQTDITDQPLFEQRFIAATRYEAGESCGAVLMRLDGALATGEQENKHELLLAPNDNNLYPNLECWRRALIAALDQGEIKLGRFPVVGHNLRNCLHHEAPVRAWLENEWRNAGQFLPWATRLGLLTRVDGAVVKAACGELAADPKLIGLSINISDDAIRDAAFHADIEATLRAHPEAATRLWLDVLEGTAIRHPAAFRSFCLRMRAMGCRIGLKHAGRHFSTVEGLHELGLDYLKLSPSITTSEDLSPDNAFLRGLCALLHSIGMIAIAEQISDEIHAHQLLALGVDGITVSGPWAKSIASLDATRHKTMDQASKGT